MITDLNFKPATPGDIETLTAMMRELYAHDGLAFNDLTEVCAEEGVNALHLEVERKNTSAQALYRKFGFEDHDRYLMTKWLR